MNLDTITAALGGTCTIFYTECCVFRPGKSSDMSSFLNHMRMQVNTLSDSTPRILIKDLISQWFKSWGFWWKKLFILGIIVLPCFLLPVHILLLCYLSPVQPHNHPKWTTSILMKPLADHSEHTVEGQVSIVRAGHKGWNVAGGPWEDVTIRWPSNWLLIIGDLLLPCPWNAHSTHHSHSGSHSKDAALRE